MKERPILFTAPMVRALLNGTKTQTRRDASDRISDGRFHGFPGSYFTRKLGSRSAYTSGVCEWECPYGKKGDRLWVRETWRVDGLSGRDALRLGDCETTRDGLSFFADCECDTALVDGPWMPSIHMPKWACRMSLEIVSVRVERLNEITDAGAQAEGVFFKDYGRQCGHHGRWQPVGDCPAPEHTHPQLPGWNWRETSSHTECLDTARGAFANLWNHVNGAGAWDANPWVWVLEFKRVEASHV